MHLVKTHLVFQKKIYIQDGDDAQFISVINKLINGIHIFFNSDSFQIVLLLQQPLIPCFFFSAGPLRLQDHFLRAGLHAAAAGSQRVRLVPQLRRHRSDVERRLHHPKVHLTSHVLILQVRLCATLCN